MVVVDSDATEAARFYPGRPSLEGLLGALAGVKQVVEPAVQVLDEGKRQANASRVESPTPQAVDVLQHKSKWNCLSSNNQMLSNQVSFSHALLANSAVMLPTY